VGIGTRKEKEMQHTRSRKLRTLVATLAVAAVAAPVTQAGVEVDARHQALLDKAPQVQLDSHHKALLMHKHAGELVYVSTPPAKISSGGTGWDEVGIGAGAVFGLILLGTGTLLVSRKKLASA
jgi:hypothetical protein